MRGKYLSAQVPRRHRQELGFCDVIWLDSNDQLYDIRLHGLAHRLPDATVRILPATGRDIPFEPKPRCICRFAGRAEAVCARGTLRRVLERAAGMGYAVTRRRV